ncbi:MAG TPA: GntR family transcriptional regulator [Aliidongia sp.]|uniref:GntR family transcriptional regulator n=1 Tax=Aliidongia sp. TaxID=1914230 RepID=UPI002DDCC731|nr:GntR family transcriptional regulator [Aliidongia sp.]HEV2675834.1 GntR family transcriptional regulator [Aliidongia sp.]
MTADGPFDSAALSPENPLPLYQQLARHFRRLIGEGTLHPDEALPPERELAERLNVSRVTLRKALQALAEDGLVDQRPRAGTYVRRVHIEQALTFLTGFTDDMRQRGLTPGSRWLDRTVATATPDEVAALQIAPGETVSRLWRVRLADGNPLALELATVPTRFLADPLDVGASLYNRLKSLGYAPHRAQQRIGATVLNRQQASLLGVPIGTPALAIERRSFLADGRPLELMRSQYRGDSYDVLVELTLHDGRNQPSSHPQSRSA